MKSPKVAMIMGSDTDLAIMNEGAAVLKEFGVAYEIKILSAHRSPGLVSEFASKARDSGLQVIIAGAGGAAHLAGALAAHTTLPVIGVPIDSTALNGLDALLSTVQMPAGIPVATVAVGKPGARNAALLAIQMLALSDDDLKKKLLEHKRKLADSVRQKNESIQGKS